MDNGRDGSALDRAGRAREAHGGERSYLVREGTAEESRSSAGLVAGTIAACPRSNPRSTQFKSPPRVELHPSALLRPLATMGMAMPCGTGEGSPACWLRAVSGVCMVNSVPTLGDFATAITLLENTVNAAPQLLDADVTFTDPEDNFDGGTLVVSGLLAEDRCRSATRATAPARSGWRAARCRSAASKSALFPAAPAATLPSPSTPRRHRRRSRR